LRAYRLELVNGDLLAGVEGATRAESDGLIVRMPGSGGGNVSQQISFVLR
jgi:hypothetical protein